MVKGGGVMALVSLEELKIRTGAIVDPHLIYILMEDPVLAEQDVPHTGVVIWQPGKQWIRTSLDYDGISIAATPGDPAVRKVVIVGTTGKCTVITGGKATPGVIKHEDALASVNYAHDSVIAVGIRGGIYRMQNRNSWKELNNKSVKENLSAVCAHPSAGFLVCGWRGLMALYDRGTAERLESGTNVILTSVICDNDGEIIACGQNGTIVRGNKDTLKRLDLQEITVDFWSIIKFQKAIYVASTTELYKLIDDETLELVKFDGEVIPTSFYHLDTYKDSLMLSVGQRDAVLFDGKEWTRIL
jgi:hypothetical protein